MKIAFIADLHGNRPATEALERDLITQKADRILCLGDIVGKGPSSDFTFDWAFANCERILGGNWDYGVGKQLFLADAFLFEQLGAARLKKLCELPLEYELTLCDRRIRMFHGRPVMPELLTVGNDYTEIMPYFTDAQGKPFDAVIYADAHRQALRSIYGGLLINTGSVGNALGIPKCCYLLLECQEMTDTPDAVEALEFRFRQISYDTKQAVLDAQLTPRVAHIESYIREIQTGMYSR